MVGLAETADGIKKTAKEIVDELVSSKDSKVKAIAGLFKILILGPYAEEQLLQNIKKELSRELISNEICLVKELADPKEDTKRNKEKTACEVFHILLMVDCGAPGFVTECNFLIDNTGLINKSLLFVDEKRANFKDITDVTKHYCHFPHIFQYDTDKNLVYKSQRWVKKETYRLAHIYMKNEMEIVRKLTI